MVGRCAAGGSDCKTNQDAVRTPQSVEPSIARPPLLTTAPRTPACLLCRQARLCTLQSLGHHGGSSLSSRCGNAAAGRSFRCGCDAGGAGGASTRTTPSSTSNSKARRGTCDMEVWCGLYVWCGGSSHGLHGAMMARPGRGRRLGRPAEARAARARASPNDSRRPSGVCPLRRLDAD